MTVFAEGQTAMECKQQCEINQTQMQLPQCQLYKLVISCEMFPRAEYDIIIVTENDYV
jgi:uncharacterized protein YlaN (UPF0358 family)